MTLSIYILNDFVYLYIKYIYKYKIYTLSLVSI